MLKFRLFLSIVMFCYSISVQAQNSTIDSLNQIISKNISPTKRIRILYQIASEQLNSGAPILALKTANKIIGQKEQIKDTKILVNTYLVLSSCYSQTFEMDSSLYFITAAKKLALKSSYLSGYYKSQISLANYHINLGEYAQSDSVASTAIEDLLGVQQSSSEDLNQQLARLYGVRGVIPLYLSTNLAKSRPYLRKAIAIYKENGSKYDESAALINLGYSFHFNNEFDSALQYYLKNLTLVRAEAFYKQEISIVANISDIFQVTNNPDKAKSIFLEYLNQNRNFTADERSLAYAGIVNILHAQSKIIEAKKYINKLIPLTDSTTRVSKSGHCISLANQFFHEQKWDSLGVYLDIAKKHINGPNDENALLYLDAVLDQNSNNESEAKRKFINLFQGQQDVLLKSQVSKNLAEIYESEKNFPMALHYYKICNKLNDSLENIETQRVINDASAKYDTEKKESENKLLKAQNAEQTAIAQSATFKKKAWSFAAIGAALIALFSWLWFSQRRKATQQELALEKQKFSQRIEQQENKNLQAILDALEEERSRIGADIHDRIGAGISTVKLYFEGMKQILDKGNKKLEENFKHVDQLLTTSIEEVRKVSHNVTSGVLSDFGLIPALMELRETIQSSDKISFRIEQDFTSRLEKNVEINIYRISQELISNSIKHSNCSEIILNFTEKGETVLMSYKDNGIGFNPNFETSGVGQKNIAARVENIKGIFSNDSEIGVSTLYKFEFPI